ncbi:MAG: LarC family nickel insertion protein, partial [Chloroflexi bacterium]|nr:LarC family nickel insertion protein [Chloroflexota bacterium]
MKLAYVEALRRVDGEMLLGALCDAGLDPADLAADLAGLAVRVEAERLPGPATRVRVIAEESPLPPLTKGGKDKSDDATPSSPAPLTKGGAGGIALQRILDRYHAACAPRSAISDLPSALIAGFCAGLRRLGIEQVAISPLPVGLGAPAEPDAFATAALLQGYPVRGVDVPGLAVTPVAAAILTGLADQAGPLPAMTLERVGHGAAREGDDLVRLWIGQAGSAGSQAGGAGLQVRALNLVETNIDDMDPEFYDHLMARLFAAGALDVTLAPMQMKKNRPATLLRALCPPERLAAVRDLILRETTTLGVRVQEVLRYALPRRMAEVQTPWGPVRVKVAELPDGLARPIPEYEDCRRLAESSGAPLWQVYAAAQALAGE